MLADGLTFSFSWFNPCLSAVKRLGSEFVLGVIKAVDGEKVGWGRGSDDRKGEEAVMIGRGRRQ